jgi:hypothetical protein
MTNQMSVRESSASKLNDLEFDAAVHATVNTNAESSGFYEGK